MQWARRNRRRISLVLGIFALVAMTLGYLKRIGIDPLGPPDRDEERAAEE
tara:strand:- start:363 stop:512 length:150 start_codon:yes stop_codon:yes gene_type:complete